MAYGTMMSVHFRAVLLDCFAVATIGWLIGSVFYGKVWLPARGKQEVIHRDSAPVRFWIEIAMLAGFTAWTIYLAVYANFWLK
jgi:hypothetical protein